jgi:hypothetical protein
MRLVKYILTFIVTPNKSTFSSNNLKHNNMKKLFFVKKYTVLLLMTGFLSSGCNNPSDNGDSAEQAKAADSVETAAEPASTAAALLSGTLDSLWVDSLTFTKLGNNPAVFSFYVGGLDTLTLHGWAGKGICKTSYTPYPDITLYKGKPSPASYGPGTYLGNVILDKNSVKNIIKVLKDSAAQYVLFAPQRSGAYINYKIYLSKEYPTILVKTRAIIDPNASTNPSPPKN